MYKKCKKRASLYKCTIRPCLKYYFHVLSETPNYHLDVVDKL